MFPGRERRRQQRHARFFIEVTNFWKKTPEKKAELAAALGRNDGLDDANLMLRSAVAPEIGAPSYIPLGLSGASAQLIADS
jgi:hypothetical protein